MAEGKFVVVFHEDLIAHYQDVWDDDKALATWLRLFALADRLWPSPAELPRSVSQTAVKQLIASGLLEVGPHHRFKVRGLDARRQAAKDAAVNAANKRWGNADSNADSNAGSITDSNPHARAQSSSASGNGLVNGGEGYGEGVGKLDPEWPAMVWLSQHKASVTEGTKLHLRLVRLCEKHTPQEVIRRMASLGDGLEANQYILGVDNELNPIPSGRPVSAKDERAALLEEIRHGR